MPIPVKPCEGKISDATKQLLHSGRDRARWSSHVCQICGQSVGVQQLGGDWIAEKHWPSITYPVRKHVQKSAPRVRSENHPITPPPAEIISSLSK